MPLTSCTSTPNGEEVKIHWPCFPDPILEDNSRVYQKPNYRETSKQIYEEDGFVIVPKKVWEQYYLYEDELIMPEWYWLNVASFVVDYEAAIERLRILEEMK